ncbi:MAG: hemerythrin family protein [Hyphomicrobiales bacterium]|nr:hemerythrin family protein [Hyphomicrobiales bacterium]
MIMLRWRDNLSLDVPVIDKDHKKLIQLLNRVHYLNLGGEDRKGIRAALDELLEYTRTHFAREEMLMRLAAYPEYDSHCRAHAALTRKVDELTAEFDKSPETFSVQAFYTFVAEWLYSHIATLDTKIKPYVENLEESQAA